MKAAIYMRVSTDEQTTENQRRELEQVASKRGWEIVATYEDQGISGAKGRDKRPGFDRLNKDAARGKFDVVMAWSVDRLSRSLSDLVTFMRDLNELGVQLYLYQQALDTTTPSGRLMFTVCGAFAEYEREILKQRVLAGVARARAQGRIGGRKPVVRDAAPLAAALRAEGKSGPEIARELGIGLASVWRALKLYNNTAASDFLAD